MASAIPILWSDDIKVDIVTPLAILRAQTGPISDMTQGLLRAEVTTTTGDSARVRHHLDLIAPVLNGYRHRLLAATHEKGLVYPVTVEAEIYRPDVKRPGPIASTEQEFIQRVSEVLHSSQVRSVIQSLIANSNESRNNPPSAKPREVEEGDPPDPQL